MIDWSQAKTAEDKQAEAEAAATQKANAEALAYLASTDWYIVRSLDSGKPIPDDIASARQSARDSITTV